MKATRAWTFSTSCAWAVEVTTALPTSAAAANNRIECCNKERSPRVRDRCTNYFRPSSRLASSSRNWASVKGS